MKKTFIVTLFLFLLTQTIRTQSQGVPKPPNIMLGGVSKFWISIHWKPEKENIQYIKVEKKGCESGVEDFKEINQAAMTIDMGGGIYDRFNNWDEVDKTNFDFGRCDVIYRVFACNKNGCSTPSNELTVNRNKYHTLRKDSNLTIAICSTPDHKEYIANTHYHIEFSPKEAPKYFKSKSRFWLVSDEDGKHAEFNTILSSLVKKHNVSGIYLAYMPLDSNNRPLRDTPGHYLAWSCSCGSEDNSDEELDCYPLRYGDKKVIESHTDNLPEETARMAVSLYAYDYMEPVK